MAIFPILPRCCLRRPFREVGVPERKYPETEAVNLIQLKQGIEKLAHIWKLTYIQIINYQRFEVYKVFYTAHIFTSMFKKENKNYLKLVFQAIDSRVSKNIKREIKETFTEV